MIAIVKRNCKIYFNNRTNVLFSLLGSLIVFALYVLFLRENTISQVEQLKNGALLIDMWLLGGILAVTALTTSLSTLGQMIRDKAQNKFMDFSITDTAPFSLLAGYFFSAVIISVLMQLVVFIVCLAYFAKQEALLLSIDLIIKTFILIILSALTATSFNLVLLSFVKSEETLKTLGSIFGALSGFLCTAYVPVGNFSGAALTIIKIFPMSYASSSFRRTLMTPILSDFSVAQSEALKKSLGVGYLWHNQLSGAHFELFFLGLTILVSLVIIGILSRKILQVTLA
ncbi:MULTISPECIES: ABC transporter permease [unclassified Enterococcus]|uniref:ABC transporter permease n=1 Tax=unclassified Enterococcus TaxID=2608891 RepID=UPI0015549E63|nr:MULTISPECIES: ABC transporter permease [unclassified Enterococcus]MBS7576910.1 ABC transporter permease [Enterococcus sp. MMGLQ5-2]MBS7584317.1 ABC transporter permease [Enterococcus sp. MMGLQ5-1]NPD12173.1 ABC transporter permease [Enterococcus sp. MMGLQ5-1]NPD36745.1 ABC transporter permease [Enterococcus sp. MMGLQ5-2]